MREQIRIFLTAVMFYTRIPVPKNVDHSPDYINKASRYFPLIGWIVGGISFMVFALMQPILGIELAVLFSLLAGIVTTGGFHEDGLADAADGFGGGWTKEKILAIMKDSRVGTYGVIALILLLLIKYTALVQLLRFEPNPLLPIGLIFISYHAIARLTAINIVFTSTYSRDDATSKVKPIAKTHGPKEIFGAYLFGVLPIVILSLFIWSTLLTVIPLTLLFLYSKRYFERKIGGYTGDCLGAVEQVAECIYLLAIIALWKFL